MKNYKRSKSANLNIDRMAVTKSEQLDRNENASRSEFFMFIIYAFQKPADVINGCESQVVHCHE